MDVEDSGYVFSATRAPEDWPRSLSTSLTLYYRPARLTESISYAMISYHSPHPPIWGELLGSQVDMRVGACLCC